MANIEVLVATMNQKDAGLYKRMNLQTDAIICNQDDRLEFMEYSMDNGCNVKMYTTDERGVGKNRNIGLSNATADICMIADDDIRYVEGYDKIVLNAFNKFPKADAIIFQIDSLNKERTQHKIKRDSRTFRLFSTRYPGYRVVFKRESVIRANIWFSIMFGGGAKYGSGEDSIFIYDLFKHGLKVYKCKDKIADVGQASSTWFKGYNDQYFFDKGALFCAMTKRYAKLAAIIAAFKICIRQKGKHSFFKILPLMYKGIKDYSMKNL